LSTIQEEVQDLEPVKVLNKRTRSGKEAEPSPPQPAQPAIPRRKETDASIEKALHLVKRLRFLLRS